jgi:hypothetical protein
MAAVQGSKEIANNIDKFLGSFKMNLKKAIQDELQKVMDISQSNVPVDTGALFNSSYTASEIKGNRVIGETGYGKEYGVYVHENLETKHPIHKKHGKEYDCGGNAKFLQNSLNKYGQDNILINVSNKVKIK